MAPGRAEVRPGCSCGAGAALLTSVPSSWAPGGQGGALRLGLPGRSACGRGRGLRGHSSLAPRAKGTCRERSPCLPASQTGSQVPPQPPGREVKCQPLGHTRLGGQHERLCQVKCTWVTGGGPFRSACGLLCVAGNNVSPRPAHEGHHHASLVLHELRSAPHRRHVETSVKSSRSAVSKVSVSHGPRGPGRHWVRAHGLCRKPERARLSPYRAWLRCDTRERLELGHSGRQASTSVFHTPHLSLV